VTVSQLTVLYLERCKLHYRKHGQPTSEVQSVRDVLKRLNKLHRATLAAEFSPRVLKAVRDSMIAEGLARSTINRGVGVSAGCSAGMSGRNSFRLRCCWGWNPSQACSTCVRPHTRRNP
jgi:hypothetical protein